MIFLISPLDVIGMVFALAFAYPWALMLISRERRSALVLALVTLALSLGALTLWMLALVLIGGLRFGAVLAGMAAAFMIGQIVLLRTQAPFPAEARPPAIRRIQAAARQSPLALGAACVIIGSAALVVFNALYWPFSDDDAVSIYATHSLHIYQAGELPDDEGLYDAYPMLLPLSYVYSYLLAGEVDEYAARIVVAALGVGTLAATFVLGRALYDMVAGLAAALLLALTPAYTRWASSGYTDIPTAFFVTLAIWAAWWMAQDGSARSAFVFGVMTGLAAWSKNSALALGGSMALWIVYVLYLKKNSASLRLIFPLAAGLALTAGPWYLRNLIVNGRIVPKTVWIDQAERTAANLAPFVTHPDHFFLPGILFTAGLVFALIEALRRKSDGRDAAALLLIGALPFSAAWWWAASYDTRFLLTVLPLFAVMGGRLIVHAGQWLGVSRRPIPALIQVALVIALVAAAIPAGRKAVIFKDELRRDPLMSDTQRHRVVLGPIYDAARDLKAIPAEGRVLSDNYFLPFYVNAAGRVEVVVGGLPTRAALAQYAYLVYTKGRLPRWVEAGDVELLIERRGFRIYRVLYDGD